MSIGLRFHTISQSLGSSCSFFVPSADMPSEPNERGYREWGYMPETPTGNTFDYRTGRTKQWSIDFEDITTLTKEFVQHCCNGWIGSKQITIVAYGSSVIGTAESMASMASVGQIWGTGYLKMKNLPKETAMDLWTFSIDINEFGPNQQFT